MKINCPKCNDESDLRRPKQQTIFNRQCFNCKKYYALVWMGYVKNSKPIDATVFTSQLKQKQGVTHEN